VKLMPATVIGPRTASRGFGSGGVDRVGGAAGGGVQTSCWVLREQARGACLGFLGFRPLAGHQTIRSLVGSEACWWVGCVVAVWLVGLVVV